MSGLHALAERIPYHRSLGVHVEEIADERVRIRIPYKDENSNPGRALHGGVPASAIGIAGVLAAWRGIDPAPGLDTRTLDLSVDYLAAAIGEDIVAEAHVLRRGKELVYADVDVRTETGKGIAKGLVTHRVAPACPAERLLAARPDGAAQAPGEVPKLARALVALPFIARLGMTIVRMEGGHSVLAMPCKAETADGTGALHEGALAALLDTAGAMASWSLVGLNLAYKASTVGLHVSYHAPARAEDVVAVGRTLVRTDEIFHNAVTVSGRASRQVVATGTVTYRIVVPA